MLFLGPLLWTASRGGNSMMRATTAHTGKGQILNWCIMRESHDGAL